jgi:hypothetical protein
VNSIRAIGGEYGWISLFRQAVEIDLTVAALHLCWNPLTDLRRTFRRRLWDLRDAAIQRFEVSHKSRNGRGDARCLARAEWLQRQYNQ